MKSFLVHDDPPDGGPIDKNSSILEGKRELNNKIRRWIEEKIS